MKSASEVRASLGILYVPFAIAITELGIVKAKGLVNNISHLESLLESLNHENS